MELQEANRLYEEYKLIYDEKQVRNLINEEWYFLNSVEVVHLAPFDDTSYEVILNTIKDGKVIPFKIEVAIRCFGKPL
jgi:hypothetical protein